MLSLTGLVNARHHRDQNPCRRKGESVLKVPSPLLDARQPTHLQLLLRQIPFRTYLLSSKNLLMWWLKLPLRSVSVDPTLEPHLRKRALSRLQVGPTLIPVPRLPSSRQSHRLRRQRSSPQREREMSRLNPSSSPPQSLRGGCTSRPL